MYYGMLRCAVQGDRIRASRAATGTDIDCITRLRQAGNGKLVAVGYVDNQFAFTAMRFGANGLAENWPAQQPDLGMDDPVSDFVLIDDPTSAEDDIVLVSDNAVAKLDGQTGLLASDVGVEGSLALMHDGLPPTPSRVRAAADDKLLIATVHRWAPDPEDGVKGDGPFAIVRLLPDGTMDEAFGTGGVSVLDYEGDSNPTSQTTAYDVGLVVQNDAVIAARPAVYEWPATTYETVLIAKRRLFGDLIFGDSFDP